MLKMQPREELPKLKLTSDVEGSANRILDKYPHGDQNLPEITDKAKVIAVKSEVM